MPRPLFQPPSLRFNSMLHQLTHVSYMRALASVGLCVYDKDHLKVYKKNPTAAYGKDVRSHAWLILCTDYSTRWHAETILGDCGCPVHSQFCWSHILQVDSTLHSKASSPQKRKIGEVVSGPAEPQNARTRSEPVAHHDQSCTSPHQQSSSTNQPTRTPQQRSTNSNNVSAQSGLGSSARVGQSNTNTITPCRNFHTAQSANEDQSHNCPHGFSSQEEDGDMLDGLDFDAAFTQ